MRKDAPPARYLLMILALLASVLAVPGVGAAQQSAALGTIEGQVFSPDGFVAAGARVMLQGADGSNAHTALTNSQGRFWFSMLPAGLYDVRASAKGRASEWRRNVSVKTGRRQTTIVLHLRPQKPAPLNSSRHP